MTPSKTWLAGANSQHTTTGSRLPVLIAAILAVAAIAFSVLVAVKATAPASASTPPAGCPDGYDDITPSEASASARACRAEQHGGDWQIKCWLGDGYDSHLAPAGAPAAHASSCLAELGVWQKPTTAEEATYLSLPPPSTTSTTTSTTTSSTTTLPPAPPQPEPEQPAPPAPPQPEPEQPLIWQKTDICPDGYENITPSETEASATVCSKDAARWTSEVRHHIACRSKAGSFIDTFYSQHDDTARHASECLLEFAVAVKPTTDEEKSRMTEEQRTAAAILLDEEAMAYFALTFTEEWVDAILKYQAELAEAEAPAKTPLPASQRCCRYLTGNEAYPELTIYYHNLGSIHFFCRHYYKFTSRTSDTTGTLHTSPAYLEDLTAQILALCQPR